MSRLTRKTIIHAKIETVYGTNPGSWGPTDAVLIVNPSFQITRDVVPRELVRDYLGGSEQLVASRKAEITFDVEMAGSGAAGTAPPWGQLLRACGMAEAITAGSHVEYTPISTGFESLTIRYVLDGVMHVAKGCRGTAKFALNAYERPMISFTFWGYDTTAALHDGVKTDFIAWQRPQVITDATSGDIRIGGTYGGGANVTGGTKLVSRGLEVDLGHKLSHLKLLAGEEIDISQRETTGTMKVALSAADEITWRSDMNSDTLTSLGFNFGTVGGNKIVIFAPSVQRIDPRIEDYEGNMLFATELRLLPSAGDDDLTVTIK